MFNLFFGKKSTYLFALILLCLLYNFENMLWSNNFKISQPKLPKHKIHYYLKANDSNTNAFLKKLTTGDTLSILLALNRVDKKHLLRQDTLLFPDVFLTDIKKYSPFPDSIPTISKVHKIILFSYKLQAFGVYSNGVLLRWGPVSMGKKTTPTSTGLFHTNWKARRTVSTINRDWIMYWYFNLANFKGMSMHEFEMPGYPASHACIRMLRDDAYWLYHWADQWQLADKFTIAAYGTPVVVFGNYPFGQRKPWFNLDENYNTPHLSEEELTKETETFLPLILQRQNQRDSFLKQLPKKTGIPK